MSVMLSVPTMWPWWLCFVTPAKAKPFARAPQQVVYQDAPTQRRLLKPFPFPVPGILPARGRPLGD